MVQDNMIQDSIIQDKETAILVVSFGTTHLDTLERSIAATEEAIGKSFPEYTVYRAFLSSIVMRRLEEKHGIHVNNVEQALEKIEQDGYKKVIVQPTLILGGIEYDLLASKVQQATKLSIAMGTPLMADREDCETIADVIMEENPLKEQEALVLMGHGTEHTANDMYDMLQQIFEAREYRCFIGTVEGTPTFEDAVERLKQGKVSHAKLLPLMFVAGDHAVNDMAGDEDSLKTLVQEAGIEASPILRGLGESRRVQELYVMRVRKAQQTLKKK